MNAEGVRRLLGRIPAPELLAAGASGILVFAGVLLSGEDFYGSGTDLVTTEIPQAAFAVHWLRRGVVPMWDPFVAGGVPFPAATKGYFYPPFWLGLALSVAGAVKLTCALHLALSGAGAAWMCRPHVRSRLARALGGALFAASGFFASHLYAGHLELVQAAAYVPWMIGAVDRARGLPWRRVAWGPAALCFGLAVLAAHYQMVAVGCLGAGAFAVASILAGKEGPPAPRAREAGRSLVALAAFFAGGMLVAALQVLPLAHTLASTQRATPDETFVSSFAAAPLSFLGLFIPSLPGRDAGLFTGTFTPWEASAYAGVGALVLAAYAVTALPRRHWLAPAAVGLLGALLALGDRTPALRVLCALVPPFEHFRAPGRYLVLVSLFLSMLAAKGLDALLGGEHVHGSPHRRWSGPVVVGAGVLATVAWLQRATPAELANAVAALAPVHAAQSAPWATALDAARDDAWLALLALLAVAVALALTSNPARRRRAALALVVVAFGDPAYAARPYLRTVPHAEVEPLAPLATHLKEATGPEGRILPTPEIVQPDVGALYDLAALSGYSIFLDDRYARFVKRAVGLPLDAFTTVIQDDGTHPLLRHLGVRLVLTTGAVGTDGRARLALGDFHLVGGMGRLKVLAADAPVPRAAVVHTVERVSGELEAYARMEDPAFDLRKTLLVESDRGFTVADLRPDAHEGARITSYRPNDVAITVDAAAPGVLVLSDPYEPGWTARLDGVPVPVTPANRVMRAVAVPAGRHEVTMSYTAPGFVLGAWVSAIAVLAAFGLEALRRRGARARAPHVPAMPAAP